MAGSLSVIEPPISMSSSKVEEAGRDGEGDEEDMGEGEAVVEEEDKDEG